VEKRKLLHKSKHPIGAADLAKLSDAIGLGAAAARTLDRVLEIGDAASHALDQALHNAG
jgi:Tfp pilus assembly protein FimV